MNTLRLMTYNVHSCLGMDGRNDPERIAAVIAALRPDIVAVQELDRGLVRSGGADQPEWLARRLDMDVVFYPSLRSKTGAYGIAVFSRHPLQLKKSAHLPHPLLGQPEENGAATADRQRLEDLFQRFGSAKHSWRRTARKQIPEPRSAIWVSVQVPGWPAPVQVINTHLGLTPSERWNQMQDLLGEDWLVAARRESPAVILCGDFNATSRSPIHRCCREHLRDGPASAPQMTLPTFTSRFPLMRIDHVFHTPALTSAFARVPFNPLTRRASDHLPLLVELFTQ